VRSLLSSTFYSTSIWGVLLFLGGFNTDIAAKSKAKVVIAELGDLSPFDPAHLELLQQAVDKSHEQGVRVKAMVLSNPHNPLGRYSKRENSPRSRFNCL